MKKALKILGWTVGGLLAFVVLALLALPLWIGPVVTGVVNSVVPGYTGGNFRLERFCLNPYSGYVAVEGLDLSNPNGFKDPTAVSLKRLEIRLDTMSLFTKKIHIREILVDSPYVAYVFDSNGTNNFEQIAANAQAKMGPKEEEESKEESGSSKKVVIDRLSISGTKVTYRMLTLPIPLPDFIDIGKDSDDGASMEEVLNTVWEKIKGSITGLGNGLGAAAGALGEGATNLLKGAESLVGGDKKIVDSVKDVGSAAGKAVSDGAKAVGDGAKDALKKVGDLFGK